MKKILVGGMMAFAGIAFAVPGAASAQSGAQEYEYQQKSKKAATEKCEKRLGGVKSSAALFEKYQNTYFAKPADMSPYPTKKATVLGGKVQQVQMSKANSGPYKGKVNFVIVNDRFKGASAVASQAKYKSGDKKGKPALNTEALNGRIDSLDKQIAAWNTVTQETSKSFREGASYTKGQEYGAGLFAAKDADKSLKARNTFTVSFNSEQCQSSKGRSNVSFLNKKRAIMIRSTKMGVKNTRQAVVEARKEYQKLAEQRKNEKPNITYGNSGTSR